MASVDEFWLTDFGDPYPGEPASFRPALIIGPPESFGSAFPFAIVVPVTTARRGLSLHVEVEPTVDNGLEVTSYIQCELIRSINRKRLIHRIGDVGGAGSLAVSEVVRTLLNY